MAVHSPFLRPLGIAAGVLGIFQALSWGVLALVGILAYADVIENEEIPYASDRFQRALYILYFNRKGTNFTELIDLPGLADLANSTDLANLADLTEWTIMTPGTVVIWTSIYFGTSVIWLVISGVLLYDSSTSKFTSTIIIGWAAITTVVAGIDFAGTVTFGVDYNEIKYVMDSLGNINLLGIEYLLAPIFMMTMCARGFILWIINVGLVIYLGVAAIRLNKKGSPTLLKRHESFPRSPSFTSHYYDDVGANQYASPTADNRSLGRQNTTFQPDTQPWDNRPSTVGNQQPIWSNYPPQNGVVNPIQPIPRVGMNPSAPVTPQPTPQPDYTPPMQRAKHEPFMYGAPARPVLKNSNTQGRTYF